MSKRFFDNIELILSIAGLLVVWVAAAFFSPAEGMVWQVAALTALGVSMLHGGIFWVVRRRQRQIRTHSILEIREMLADQVKNQLAVMRMWMPEGEQQAEFEMQFAGINESIDSISGLVDELSEESLKAWKGHYSNAMPHVVQA